MQTNQTDRVAELITATIKEGKGGLFYAASDDLSGLLVVGADVPSALEDVPGVIKALFATKGVAVDVFPVKRGSDRHAWPWGAIPTEAHRTVSQ